MKTAKTTVALLWKPKQEDGPAGVLGAARMQASGCNVRDLPRCAR